MAKLRFLISLMTNDNDYQIEQAKIAEATAVQLGIDCQIIYAGNDAVTQSTQIFRAIQCEPDKRPQAIICEPVGATGLPAVARTAVNEGIGWALLNRNVDYIGDLRRTGKVPAFCVSSDHLEVGRIHGRQCAALLPSGGTVLYVQGPSESSVAKERLLGMQEAKPGNIHLIILKGQWTEKSATRSVNSWLQLSTSRKANVDLIVAQNDAMAIGARKAFQGAVADPESERWLQLPFLGVDGVPKTGQAWVNSGLLTATVFTPPNTGRAIELLVDALRTSKLPAQQVLIAPSPVPAVEKLKARN